MTKVENRPCKTVADCNLSSACDHDHVHAACVMRGPSAGDGQAVPRFCKAGRGWCDPPWILDDRGHRHYKPECGGPESETKSRSTTPSPSSGGRASECRHARGDHMEQACTSDRECASATLAKACPGVSMTTACERGHCRSRRTDGCEAPYEVDAETMRRLIVDCVK